MTDETETKIENIRQMAKKINKEDIFNILTIDSLLFLTDLDEKLTPNNLRYFLHGITLGRKSTGHTSEIELGRS